MYYVLRVAVGIFIVSGACIGLYNMIRTLFSDTGDRV
jgi:hypothetical protein